MTYCTEPDTEGRHTYPSGMDGQPEYGYVWCCHGFWSTAKLAELMHKHNPNMERLTDWGPSKGRA